MTSKMPVAPTPKASQPRVLLVKWYSGEEEINLDEIDTARKVVAPAWSTTIKTHEQRKSTGRVVVYDPKLEVSANGFTLHYKEEGYWADDNEMLQNAEGEIGKAVYNRDEKGKWSCTWFADEAPDVPHSFNCNELEQGHDWRQADVRVSNAKFRKLVLADGKGCIVARETNPAVLDAAHIYEANSQGQDSRLNGLAMRKDIHWLYDRGIITIDIDGTVTMNPILTSYEHLFKDVKTATCLDNPKNNIDQLEERANYFKLRKEQSQTKKR